MTRSPVSSFLISLLVKPKNSTLLLQTKEENYSLAKLRLFLNNERHKNEQKSQSSFLHKTHIPVGRNAKAICRSAFPPHPPPFQASYPAISYRGQLETDRSRKNYPGRARALTETDGEAWVPGRRRPCRSGQRRPEACARPFATTGRPRRSDLPPSPPSPPLDQRKAGAKIRVWGEEKAARGNRGRRTGHR